jgi:PAS domain S-box-containing protein
MLPLQKHSIMITALYVVIYYSWISLWPEDRLVGGIIAITGPILTLIFISCSLKRIKEKEDKKFWIIVFIGCFCYFIAELIWRYHVSYLQIEYQFPGMANVFYNLFVFIYTIAVFYKIYTKRKKYREIQVFLDSFIIMTVLTTISWVHFLNPLLNVTTTSTFELVMSLSYPVAHLGVLFGVVLLFLTSKPVFPPILLILNTVGITIYTIAETYYIYKSIYQSYDEFTYFTPIWNICLLLIGLSSLFNKKGKDVPRKKSTISNLFYISQNVLPYLSLIILFYLAVIEKEAILSFFIGGSVVLLLIVIKQIITIFENKSLVYQLKERTKELEATQLELLESQQRYKSLFDHHPDAIFSINPEGYILAANHSFEKITGYHFREWGNRQFIDSVVIEHIDLTLYHFMKALSGDPQNFELAILHKTGRRIELNFTFVPIVVNNKIIGVYGIAQDITEKKKTEEMLIKSEKLSVVSRLAAGVAHEIRNPLTTIKGFLQLFNTSKESKPEYVDIMLSELNCVETTIYEFLFLANPHHETVFKKVNINNTLVEVIKLMKKNSILNNIEIINNIDIGVPHIECIESQLKQVFINLIQNAIDATESNGEIYIEAMGIDQNNRIGIRFIDYGCGIPEERLHKLGEPYYSTKEKGTGIGLMVSYKIIEHHQGQIFISSKEGKGTTVEVILPLSQKKVEQMVI